MAVNSSYLAIYYVDALEDWSYGSAAGYGRH